MNELTIIIGKGCRGLGTAYELISAGDLTKTGNFTIGSKVCALVP